MTVDFRYDLTQVNVAGLDGTTYARYEWTSNAVSAAYQEQLTVLANYFNRDTGQTAVTTQADADAVATAIKNLLALARDGIVSPLDESNPASATNPTKLYFLNVEMATSLDILVRSFYAVGATGGVGDFSLTAQQLKDWKDLSVLSGTIGDTLRVALNTAPGNRSIQALVELEYVGTANDVIDEQLSDLESALTTTNGVLNTLAAIQDWHNKIVVSSRGSFQFSYNNPDDSAKESLQKYKALASVFFGTPIVPTVPASWTTMVYALRLSVNGDGDPVSVDASYLALTPSGYNAINQLISYRNSVAALVAQLSQQFTATQRNATGSLYGTLKSVYNDLLSVQVPPTDAVTQDTFAWFIDKYDVVQGGDITQQGAIQNNITKAITSAQSLNDTQKENVRNFLFVFEEYYKSASAILQQLTQTIQRMAQGIKG